MIAWKWRLLLAEHKNETLKRENDWLCKMLERAFKERDDYIKRYCDLIERVRK